MGKFIVEKHNGESIWRLYENEYGDIAGEEAYLTLYTEPDLERIRKEAYVEGYKDGQYAERNGLVANYAQEQETIQVGDEVISPDGKGVVTEINDRIVRIMYSNGSGYVTQLEELTRTGRHFPEIATILEKMRGEQDG